MEVSDKTIQINGISYPYNVVAEKKPCFCNKVMAEERIGSLRDFQQYLISLGWKISNLSKDPVDPKSEKKITKHWVSKSDGIVKRGQYKGKKFSFVFKVDYAYCKTVMKKSTSDFLEFRNWLSRRGVKLDAPPNPYQRLENKYPTK